MNEPYYNSWSPLIKLIVLLVLLVTGGFLLYKFSAVIPPIVLSLILAFVLAPLVNFTQRRLKLPRIIAILLVYLVLFVVVGTVLRVLIPVLINQARGMNFDLHSLVNDARALVGRQFVIGGFELDGRIFLSQINSVIEGLFQPVFGTTIDVVATVLESFVWVVFILVISIYLIKDSGDINKWFEQLPPPNYQQDFIRLRDEINTIWSAFFRGQLLLAVIVTGIITLECFVIGMPFPLAMGVIGGLMEFMPSVGHGIWLVLAGLVSIIWGSTWIPVPHWVFLFVVIGLHIVFTQFDLNYLIPRIIGRSVQLPPMVVILGIVGGAAVAGVLGVVLAAPMIASLRILGRYIYARLTDMNPFPDKPVSKTLPPPDIKFWKKMPRKRVRN